MYSIDPCLMLFGYLEQYEINQGVKRVSVSEDTVATIAFACFCCLGSVLSKCTPNRLSFPLVSPPSTSIKLLLSKRVTHEQFWQWYFPPKHYVGVITTRKQCSHPMFPYVFVQFEPLISIQVNRIYSRWIVFLSPATANNNKVITQRRHRMALSTRVIRKI